MKDTAKAASREAAPAQDPLSRDQFSKDPFSKTIAYRLTHAARLQKGLAARLLADLGLFPGQEAVLKQLLDEGYIIQRAGDSDRRQRLLFATAKGEALVVKLAGLQTRRIDRALTPLGPEGAEIARKFLLGLIDHDDPDKVLEVILKGGSPDMRTRS